MTARNGGTLSLDGLVDPRCNVLKWFADASPIQDVQEGQSAVTVTRGVFPVASSVLVTAGPQVANESLGELRTVIAAAGNVVTLDRPLRRSYRDAALARVQPVENVTLRDLTIELPVNAASECLQATLCRNWRLERCTIRKTALGNCAGWQLIDCDIGHLYVAASSHDITVSGCRVGQLTLEEGTHDVTVDWCRIGPCPQNANCVSVRAQSERLTLRNSVLLGGEWPSSQIYFDSKSRGCVFERVTLWGSRPCWGVQGRLIGVVSDAEINTQ